VTNRAISPARAPVPGSDDRSTDPQNQETP
jgi:hypothetical protein